MRLVSLPFVVLCLLVFLGVSAVAIFYNFHLYLSELGLSGTRAGFVIGVYSLSCMACYLFGSQRLHPGNVFPAMAAGLALIVACGAAYLAADGFWMLVVIRVVQGLGVFLLMGSAMVVLVAIIPPERTGQAFSLYSVALLAPYALMPMLSELVLPLLPSPAALYLLPAAGLIPAAAFLPLLARRTKDLLRLRAVPAGSPARPAWTSLLTRPVLTLLVVNGLYFITFSALFFLFKSLAAVRGYPRPGLFFSVQMTVMIGLRLLAGRIFDQVAASLLVFSAFACTAAAFLALLLFPDPGAVLAIAVLFGLGMGFAVPPLNSLLYKVTPPERRGYNANIMLFTVHFGSFLGPFAGAWCIEVAGYDAFLAAGAVLTVLTALVFLAMRPERDIRS